MVNPDQRGHRRELEAAFEAHRRELHTHCYRMTGSFADAEDLTQDVFVRAWRTIDRFDGRASLRTWLYRIATNACIDFLRNHRRRAHPVGSIEETLEQEGWIDPYPDRADPAADVDRRTTTDLYLTAALAHLPARQRAALIACDLLDFDAAGAAAMVGCSTAALNSLLQRARARVRQLGVSPTHRRIEAPDELRVIRAYVEAHDRGDVDTIVALLSDDVHVTMPPERPYRGAREAGLLFHELLGPGGAGEWRLTYGRANGTHAIVNHLRRAGATEFHPLSVDVLYVDGGKVRAIHCFIDPARVRAFIRAYGLSQVGVPPTPSPWA